MERRLTAFLIPLLVIMAVVMFLMPKPKQDGAPKTQLGTTRPTVVQPDSSKVKPLDEYRFTNAFGGGEPGSYWVSFDKRGAAITKIWLQDHFVDAAAKNRSTKNPGTDYYVLSQALGDGSSWGLVLEPEGSARETFAGAPIDGTPNRDGESQEWVVERNGESSDFVKFTLDCKNGYVFEKTFRHVAGRRDLEVELTLRNNSHETEEIQFGLRGLALTSPASEQMIGASASSAFGLRLEGGRTVDSGRLIQAGGGPTREELVSNTSGSTIAFAGTMNRFFAALLGPADPMDRDSQHGMYAVWVDKVHSTDPAQAGVAIPFARYELKMRPERGQAQTLRYRLYLGPKSYDVFNERPEYELYHYALDADLNPVGCFCNIPGSATVAMVLLKTLSWLHRLFGSWPLAIILMTILVRLCIVPLNFRMQKSMRAYGARMTVIKPKLDALQKRFADDPKQLQKEMIAFQREHKMFPPLGGCLPLLITMPIFFGMFTAVRAAYGLRQSPFVFWIQDLSKPDALMHLGWGPIDTLNILPFVMVGMWWIMQSSTPTPTDPQQKQMYTMMKVMPFIMGVTLYSYASGLMLYMITSSTFQIIESKVVKKILGPVDPNAAVLAPAPQF